MIDWLSYEKELECGLTSFGPLMVSCGHVMNFRVSYVSLTI